MRMGEGKIWITWDEMQDDTLVLAECISGQASDIILSPNFTILVITRGGLIPATILAHAWGTKRIETIGVGSYEDAETKPTTAPKVFHKADPDLFALGRYLFVVDDLIDTGNSFRAVQALYPQATYVALYLKQKHGHNFGLANYVGKELPDWWIVFPWEKA